MSINYPWYCKISSDEILQGDLIKECPIAIPPNNYNDSSEIIFQTMDAVVLSQSCDLENGKIEIVLVCPYFTLDYFLKTHPTSKDGSKKGIAKVTENLKHGVYPSYHLLQKDENFKVDDFLVIDFRNVYGVNFQFLKEHSLKYLNRTRLLPPYREHLSQSFARYFMRVGLPIVLDL